MTFLAVLLNVLVPLLIAGVVVYLVGLPDAPLGARAKGLVTWIVWVLAVLWVLVWVLGVLGVMAPLHLPAR